MNPGKKKQSRNEERKQAQKKGMLRFESHQSFYSFYSPKEEEFNKLLLKLKLEQQNMNSSIGEGGQQNFTYYANSNTKGEASSCMDEENLRQTNPKQEKDNKIKQSKNQILGKNSNHINFSKRNQNANLGRNTSKNNNDDQQQMYIQQVDLLSTNINFKSTFIQQKAQVNQSPSVVTNTENSNSKQSPTPLHLVLGEDGEVVDVSIVEQSPNIQINRRINEAINKNTHISPPQHNYLKKQQSPNQYSQNASINLDLIMERNNTNFYINPNLNNFKTSLKNEVESSKFKQGENPTTLDKLKKKVQTNSKLTNAKTHQFDIELEEECNENRPLKQEDTVQAQLQQMTMGIKQNKIMHSESPSSIATSQNNVAFKTFNMPANKRDKELGQTIKNKKGIPSQNKSPANQLQQTTHPQQQSFSQKMKSTQKLKNQPLANSNNCNTNKTNVQISQQIPAESTKNQLTDNQKKKHQGGLANEKTPGTKQYHAGQTSANNSKFQSKTQSSQLSSRSKYSSQKVKYNILGQSQTKIDNPSIINFDTKHKLSSLLHQESLLHQQSLRISPIPDLSQTLDLSKECLRDDDQLINTNAFSQMNLLLTSNNSIPLQLQIYSPQTLQGGGGVKTYGSRKSSLTKQSNKPSLGSKNLFNYNSTSTLHRVCDKSGKGVSQLSGAGELDVSGKSKFMFGDKKGQIFPSTTRHQQKNSLFQRKTQNNSEYQSCRSSNLLNDKNDNKKRSSELVVHSNKKVIQQQRQQRSSGNLEFYKQKHDKVFQEENDIDEESKSSQKFIAKNSITDNNTLCNYYSAEQTSDIVSQGNQADGPNNISISILKSSPRFIHNQNAIGQFKQRPPLSKGAGGNFLIQGSGSQSLQTSMDLSNIHHILNAFKSNLQNGSANQTNDMSQLTDIGLTNRQQQQQTPSLKQEQLTQNKITLIGILEGMPYQFGKSNLRSISVETFCKQDQVFDINSPDDYEQMMLQQNQLQQKRKDYGMNGMKLKQVQSPQTSSLITSSNKYLKSLQSQEFQKNESDKKHAMDQQPNKQNEENQTAKHQNSQKAKQTSKHHHHQHSQNEQSQDSLKLMKHSSNGDDALKQRENKLDKKQSIQAVNASSQKLNYKSKNHHYHHNNNNNNNNTKKQSEHEGYISTKSQQKNTNLSKQQINMDEINHYNDTIQRIDNAKKQAQRCQKKGLNILEEALTSKSHSRKSYQSSSSSFASSPKQNSGDFQSSKIFKTTLHASHTQKQDIMPSTMKNSGVPVKKFAFQDYEISNSNNKDRSDSNIEVIDFPKQMENDKYVELHRHDISDKSRTSKLMMEIDQMMENGNSITSLTKLGSTLRRGSQGSRLLINRESHSQCGSYKHNNGSSHLNPNSQPLIEIKYSSNEQNIDNNSKKSVSLNSTGVVGMIYHRHGNSDADVNDSKVQFQGLQMGIYELPIDQQNKTTINGQTEGEVTKKKRSLRPHGQTTCFIFPSKDSIDYIKRDLNQDVFCKINSHQGDVDKDPHTPKSQGSPRSIEKNRRNFLEKRHQIQLQNTGSINSLKMTMFSSTIDKQLLSQPQKQYIEQEPYPHKVVKSQEGEKEDLNTPSRHSSSVDGRQKIQNGFQNRLKQQNSYGSFELAPFQGNRKLEQRKQEEMTQNDVRIGQSDEMLYDGQRENSYDIKMLSNQENKDNRGKGFANLNSQINQRLMNKEVFTGNPNQSIQYKQQSMYEIRESVGSNNFNYDDENHQFKLIPRDSKSQFEINQLNIGARKMSCNNDIVVQYEILFEDSDLKDTDDKFTSRDENFSKLKAQRVIEP